MLTDVLLRQSDNTKQCFSFLPIFLENRTKVLDTMQSIRHSWKGKREAAHVQFDI